MYKKILVTGHTGFVGTNLCEYLWHQIDGVEILTAQHDLRERDQAYHLINALKPDCIIHLAATCGGIGANRAAPGKFMYDNLIMGINVIDVARRVGSVEKFVMMGTICAYPKYCKVPFKEADMWNGYPEETNAPYGIAKKTLTELLIAYHKQYGFNSVNLFPTNMYGPHDTFRKTSSHVIPAIILKVYEAMSKGEDRIDLWGTGGATRDFLYVEDCCNAIFKALYIDPGPHPINIGTGVEISIKEIAETICALMNFNGELRWDDSQPDGQPRRCVDSNRAMTLLGYKSQITIHQGLRRTINWFLNNTNEIPI